MTGYEYGNTRLRAMRSRLFARSDYLDMMGAGSLDRMLAILSDTPYSADVEEALVRGSGIDRLDRVLRTNLAGTLRKMASFYEGRPAEMVSLLLSRWDLANLLTLIRFAATTGSARDGSAMVVPAGRLDESELAELATRPDVASLVDLMVAWDIPSPDAAFALLRARSRFVSRGDLSELELVVERTFAGEMDRLLESDGDFATSILRAEIDARNLELALRSRAARLDEEPGWFDAGDGYAPGGHHPSEIWEQVADTDAPEEIARIAGSGVPIPGWKEALAAWVGAPALTVLADRLRRVITSAAVTRFVRGDPLGFDIPLAYTFAKEAEVRNLHLVGRGLVHQLPIAAIEERLEVAA